MIEADDGSLYTGVTTDIARRFLEHQGNGRRRGARFFHGRNPVGVVYLEPQADRGGALSREAAIKKMKRAEKVGLKQSVMYFR